MQKTNSILKNKNYLSSGNLFLDKITDGISLGSIVLLVEDNPSKIHEQMLKYFIAEGVVNNQKIFFYNSDQAQADTILKNLPYKSTQVDSILNAKRVMDKNNNNEIKIAWRYENIQYSNLLEDLAKNSEYIFDLSRKLQDVYLIDNNKNIIKSKIISNKFPENLKEIISYVTRDVQDYTINLEEDQIKLARIVIPNLFQDDCKLNSNNINNETETIIELKKYLIGLKNIARSINAITYITIDRSNLNSKVFNLLHFFSDYVFSLKSFIIDSERMEEYDALFYVNKLPRICSMKTPQMETDTYGVTIEKRKVVIEKIDIGVEVDRNTKIKEKDLTASQAICGQEKYSKNFEF